MIQQSSYAGLHGLVHSVGGEYIPGQIVPPVSFANGIPEARFTKNMKGTRSLFARVVVTVFQAALSKQRILSLWLESEQQNRMPRMVLGSLTRIKLPIVAETEQGGGIVVCLPPVLYNLPGVATTTVRIKAALDSNDGITGMVQISEASVVVM